MPYRDKAQNAAYCARHRKEHPEEVAARERAWREANKEKIAAYRAAWRKANREKIAIGNAKYREANREKLVAKDRAYRKANPGKRSASDAKYHKAHRERISIQTAAYRKANRERIAAHKAQVRRANREKRNADTARRRARKLRATPPWLTREHRAEILGFYKTAKILTQVTGERFEVDHIVPLRGETVRGLHVPWNLQVITHSANIQKNNRLQAWWAAILS